METGETGLTQYSKINESK